MNQQILGLTLILLSQPLLLRKYVTFSGYIQPVGQSSLYPNQELGDEEATQWVCKANQSVEHLLRQKLQEIYI